MIGNKIVDNITSISKKSNKELPNNDEKEEDMEITAHNKCIYIYHQKKDKELLMN